jgi:membrane protease YdiL (CAAX protease family)
VALYFKASELPLASLVFVLPFLVIYELGAHVLNLDHARFELVAFRLMRDFFGFFGATGRFLPAMAVVGVLLTWHIARNDPWKVRSGTLLGMFLESAALGVPLILACIALAPYLPLAGTMGDIRGGIIISLGAGIYEELIFRLCAMTMLSLLLADLLKLQRGLATVLIVLIPAVLFSAYHYLGDEHFAWGSFVFRSLAGVYFGLVFLVRGFGITAGAHAAYDIWIVALLAWHGR